MLEAFLISIGVVYLLTGIGVAYGLNPDSWTNRILIALAWPLTAGFALMNIAKAVKAIAERKK